MLRIKGNEKIDITQEMLNKANIELYHELRPELSEMLDNITIYLTLKKYVKKEYITSMEHLVFFYAKYLKSMYFPITENGYSELFLEVKNHIEGPLWKEHIDLVMKADIDQLFTLSKL